MRDQYLKEIVKRSGILNENLWDDIDSIMTDTFYNSK